MENQINNERIDILPQTGTKIIQIKKSFCFGIDAILLSNFAKAHNGNKIVDLGT